MDRDDPNHRDLDPSGIEEAHRTLGLEDEGRGDLPGLHRLNTVGIPLARTVGFTVALAVAPFHNRWVLGGVDLSSFLILAVVVEGYCLLSWVALRRWYARETRVDLAALFVWTDLLVMTGLIYWTGGPRSLYWPIYFVRVADQIWISRKRAVAAAVAGVGLYLALDLAVWSFGGQALDWGVEAAKLAILGGMSLALAVVASRPWDVRSRVLEARDLLEELGERSQELLRERHRAETESRAKTAFLSRMSHELRTPLNSLLGFTNVLLKNRRLGLGARELDYLQRVRSNAMHLLALTNDMVDLERIERGELVIHSEPVDVGRLVRDTVQQLEGRTLDTAVSLTARVPDGLRPAQADEDRLRQVLVNLIEHGLQVTRRGSVHVEIVEAEDDPSRPAEIRVRDAGPGIPPEELSRIMDPPGLPGGEGAEPGTGLALAVSRSFCRLMGMDLTVESELDKGTTFAVVIPPVTTPGPHPG